MFKGHPKALFVMFMANMGERFGFYTMVSIFVLFLQAKYGMTASASGFVYSTFMFGVYFFPLLGGFLADKVLGYGKNDQHRARDDVHRLHPARRPVDDRRRLRPGHRGPGRHRPRHRPFQGQPPGARREPLRRPQIQPPPRPGLQHLLHGDQRRRHVRPDGLREGQQLDPRRVALFLRCPDPGPGQQLPQGNAGQCRRLPGHRPGPGPRGDARHAQGVLRKLHQRPQQVLPLRLRRRLHQPDHLHADLLGLPEVLQPRRPQRKAEGQVRGPSRPDGRAVAPGDERAAHRPRLRLLRRHLLLDGLPAERGDHDVLRPGLHGPARGQGLQPLVRPGRAAAPLPVRHRPGPAAEEGLAPAHPGHRRSRRSPSSASWPT